MTLHSDTDGDLRAVPPAPGELRGNAAGTPRPADFAAIDDWDQFADVTSHELGSLTRRMIEALARRSDATAAAELHRLYQTLGSAMGDDRPS